MGTTEQVLLKEINSRLEEIRDLLTPRTSPRMHPPSVSLSQEDLEELDAEINLDWWYRKYGEDPYPAKYMNPNSYPSYAREESHYLANRLKEIASMEPLVNDGTHVFTYVGKKYCKGARNTFYCFACVPVAAK